MKYRMVVKIVDPNTEEGMTSELIFILDCEFVCNEKDYGNGYHVGIEGGGFYEQYYDLRYDTTFRSDKKMTWLTDWAESYWNGKNGAYKVKSIEIAEV